MEAEKPSSCRNERSGGAMRREGEEGEEVRTARVFITMLSSCARLRMSVEQVPGGGGGAAAQGRAKWVAPMPPD